MYDSLVLGGPPVVVAILAAGRNAATIGLAVLYVGLFVSYLAYRKVGRGEK